MFVKLCMVAIYHKHIHTCILTKQRQENIVLSLTLKPFCFLYLKETKKIMQMWNVQFKHGTVTHLGVEMGKRVSSSLPSVRIKQQNTTEKVLEAYSPQYLFS